MKLPSGKLGGWEGFVSVVAFAAGWARASKAVVGSHPGPGIRNANCSDAGLVLSLPPFLSLKAGWLLGMLL